MSSLKKIGLVDFIEGFNALKDFHKDGHDPLPEIGDENEIESVLEYPFQNVFGRVLFWGFYRKAACYFYSFSKGHIFPNGNKRAGVLAVNLFYEINERELSISQNELYNLAKYIANSNASEKDEVITSVAFFLKDHK